jgi:hypothetical protein
LNSDGSFTYTPNASFTGTDTFTYRANDGSADSNLATVTITVAPATLNFFPDHDATVYSNDPTGNYGASETLELRDQKRQTAHSYLKFNVVGVTSNPKSVKLRLFSTVGSNSTVAVYLVSNEYLNSSTPWDQGGLTWNNAPTISGTPLATINSISSGVWIEFDLTQVVTADGVYSFGLTNDSPNRVAFNSKEAPADQPVLIVTP